MCTRPHITTPNEMAIEVAVEVTTIISIKRKISPTNNQKRNLS